MIIKKNQLLFIFLVLPLIVYWIYIGFVHELDLKSLYLTNLKDIEYFPVVYALSEFKLNPSFLENLNPNGLIGFPMLPLIIHSFFYKIFGIYSFVLLEIIFKLIFFLVLIKFLNEIFIKSSKSLLFIFLLLIFIEIGNFFSSYLNIILLQNLIYTLTENFETRFPRPLISGIVFFYAFKVLSNFEIQKFEKKYYLYSIKLGLCFGLLLNIFFYHFVNFSFLLFVLIVKQYFNYFKVNKYFIKNILCSFFVFFLFFLIFYLQQYYIEPDWAERIGVISITAQQKLFVLFYYFRSLVRIEFLFPLLISIILFINSNYFFKEENLKKKNIIFYFIICSIITPIVFIFVSPKIVSLHHFIHILKFSIIFYIFVESYELISFFLSKIYIKRIIKNYFIMIVVIVFFIVGFYNKLNIFNNNLDNFKDLVSTEKYLLKENIKSKKLKLFTNDLTISNLWLNYNNRGLVISDGFITSLKNDKIEYNFINSMKAFGLNNDEFKKFISFEKSQYRNRFFMYVFNYRYLANSLVTYSPLSNYDDEMKNKIINTSPFRVESQIVPNDEKEKFLKMFNNHKINKSLFPDYIILKLEDLVNELPIKNKIFELIISNNTYKIYKKS